MRTRAGGRNGEGRTGSVDRPGRSVPDQRAVGGMDPAPFAVLFHPDIVPAFAVSGIHKIIAAVVAVEIGDGDLLGIGVRFLANQLAGTGIDLELADRSDVAGRNFRLSQGVDVNGIIMQNHYTSAGRFPQPLLFCRGTGIIVYGIYCTNFRKQDE